MTSGRDYNDAGSSSCDSIAPESHSQIISAHAEQGNIDNEMIADDLDEGASAHMLMSQHKYTSNNSNGHDSPVFNSQP